MENTDSFPEDQRTIRNEEYVNEVVKNNVLHTIPGIRNNSSIIEKMEENGEIKILGAFIMLLMELYKFL